MNRHPFADKNTYITDRQLISGSDIWEYDIKQANINILLSYDIISFDDYFQLSNSPKYVREVIIGKRIQFEKVQNKKSIIEDTIQKGISEAKNCFLISNKIQPRKIVRIANDAVYVENTNPMNFTSFDLNSNNKLVKFVCKNHFSSLIKFSNNILVLFGIMSDDNFNVDVKGIGDNKLKYGYHSMFLSLICEILMYKERSDIDTTLSVFNDYYNKYIKKELSVEYYREFNSSSGYRLNLKTNLAYMPAPTYLDESFDKDKLDISYNLHLLRELYSLILR